MDEAEAVPESLCQHQASTMKGRGEKDREEKGRGEERRGEERRGDDGSRAGVRPREAW